MLTASSRWEAIDTITLPNKNQPYNMPNQGGLLGNEYYLAQLQLRVRLRITNPAAPNAPTAVLADAPFSLIERVIVSGYHTLRQGQEEFINLRGADLRQLCKMYTTAALQVSPATTSAQGIVPNLSIAADATNDIDFVIPVPFWPLQLPLAEQLFWLLDAPNYNNLKLTIQWADENSVFSGQGAAMSFTAFGSATGSPTIEVSRQLALDSNKFAGFIPARLWRYYFENTGTILTTASQARIFDIPRGYRIRSLLFKTGVRHTATSAGNTAYASLSNTILANIYAYRGTNKLFRRYNRYTDIQSELQQSFGIPNTPEVGYAMSDFAQHGNLQEVFDATGLVVGGQGDIDCFIQGDVTGAANQGAVMVVEELRGQPVGVPTR